MISETIHASTIMIFNPTLLSAYSRKSIDAFAVQQKAGKDLSILPSSVV
jgi:hypothetical protein